MSASAVIRQGVACTMGTLAWWYFYSVETLFYPPWIGVIVAAFVITLVVVIISDNIILALVIAVVYYLIFTPIIVFELKAILPIVGGTVAGIALWKIL